jgi:hypothetical protein
MLELGIFILGNHYPAQRDFLIHVRFFHDGIQVAYSHPLLRLNFNSAHTLAGRPDLQDFSD